MMQQNWWEAAPLANQPQAAPRPLIPAPPKQPTPQTPDQAALTQGQVQRLPLENEQTRASTASTIANMGQIPLQNDNTRTNIQQGQTSIRTSLQQAEQQLRDDFEKRPEVQNFRVVLPQYSSAIRAADNKAGDLQIVYAFSKVMDPGSVVRESETASAGSVGSVSDQVSGYLRSLSGGGRLPPDVRKQLLLEIRNRASGMADMYNQTRSQYEGLARQHGFNADAIIGPHPAIPYQQAEADFVGHPIKNGNGFTYPRGQQPPQAGQPQRPAPAQPFDPSGQGDIGFVNGGQAAALPPGAQEAKRDVDAQIAAGKLRSYAEIAAYTKQKYNFDAPNDPKLAAQIDDALSHGRPIVFNPPEWAKPNIDDARGHTDPNVNAVVGGITAGASGVPLTLDEIKAGGRGGTNSALLGADDWIRAGVNTLRDGQPFSSNFARERQIDQYDEQNNPGARLGGQVLGSLAMPTGAPGEAATAGRIALRSGLGREAANAAARRAFAGRIGREGAAAGGAYGFLNSNGDFGDRLESGLAGAAGGGLGGYGLTRTGQGLVRSAPLLRDGYNYVRNNIPQLPGSARQDAVDAADRLGVRPTPATIGGMTTGFLQFTGGNMPGTASAVQAGVDRETGDLSAAAGRAAAQLGPIGSREQAGNAVTRGAQAFDRASSAAGGRLYQQRDALMGGTNAPVRMDQTQRTILDLNNQFPNSPAIAQLNEHPVIRRIWQGLPNNNSNELTLGEATEALSHVRGVVRNLSSKREASGPILARVGQVEQSLENDVMAAAQRADAAAGRTPGAPGSAALAQRQADAYWANKKAVTGRALKTAMRSAQDDLTVSGSTVFNQLVGDMSAKGGNMRRLTTAWRNLPQGARRTFSATAFDQMGRATSSNQNAEGSAWSFQTFMTNWDTMHPAARNLVFGGRGVDQQIQDIATYSSRLRDIDRMRNFPNTARNILMGSFLTVVGGALWKGDVGTAAGMAAALPAAHGFASAMMATPAMRQWTRTTLQAMTTGNQRALLAQTNRLQAIASREPAFAQQILGLRQAIMSAANDNVGRAGPLAASPDQRPDQPQQ